ncbi:hypothetical protein ACTFIY_009859 [Dictyostelium cf. discoideum]
MDPHPLTLENAQYIDHQDMDRINMINQKLELLNGKDLERLINKSIIEEKNYLDLIKVNRQGRLVCWDCTKNSKSKRQRKIMRIEDNLNQEIQEKIAMFGYRNAQKQYRDDEGREYIPKKRYFHTFKSLETVNVKCLNDLEHSLTNSKWILTYLNELDNKDLIINFKLELFCREPYEPTDLEHIEKEEFKFKTNLFDVEYDYEYKANYGFLYEMIKELNPKYLKIKSNHLSDSGSSHLLQYHSISKLNQNYESVEIINDYIPLYALYRFLQSPNLHTLKFDLQFHFLSSIYDNYQINNNNNNNNNKNNNNNNNNRDCESNRDSKYSGYDKTELDFNKMDNFKFIIFENIGNYHKCSRDFMFRNTTIFNVSWNRCLKLLSTNSTITNLSITQNCGGECRWDYLNSLFNENFLNDFMNSLANNKTIKTLTLNFNENGYANENLIKKYIVSMLDRNTTLESIYIFNPRFKEISNLTKNTKCKIITE